MLARVRARRAVLLASLAAIAAVLLAAMAISRSEAVVRTAAWLHVWTALALVLVASAGWRGAPWLRSLSDATYAVYLFHLFFVYAAASLFPPPPLRADFLSIAAPFAAGLLGSLALVAALRRVLGARSRDWIGA